jgi:hypothetical protein
VTETTSRRLGGAGDRIVAALMWVFALVALGIVLAALFGG